MWKILKVFSFFFKYFFSEAKIKFDGIFENISFVKIESSKLINYSTNMCRSGQGTTVVVRPRKVVNKLSFYDDKDNEWVKCGFVLDPIIQSLCLL